MKIFPLLQHAKVTPEEEKQKKEHKKKLYKPKATNPLACPKCGKLCKSRAGLAAHFRNCKG